MAEWVVTDKGPRTLWLGTTADLSVEPGHNGLGGDARELLGRTWDYTKAGFVEGLYLLTNKFTAIEFWLLSMLWQPWPSTELGFEIQAFYPASEGNGPFRIKNQAEEKFSEPK